MAGRTRSGSMMQRSLIWLMSSLLMVLLIWLLGFVLRDIDRMEQPSMAEIEATHLEQELLDERDALLIQAQDLQRQRNERGEDIAAFRQSMDNAQGVFEELIVLDDRTVEQQEALDESQLIFLTRPQEIEAANEEIRRTNRELRSVEERRSTVEARLEEQREPAREEYQSQMRRHSFKEATLKLLFLIPLLLAAAWIVMKKKGSPQAPMAFAALSATFFWVAVVSNQYFPARFFKYIALAVAIGVVVFLTVKLIRMVTAPDPDLLLKQNREAYNRRLCPVCAYPIRVGPHKHALWTRKGPQIANHSPPHTTVGDEGPYRCPSCGEQLFEECSQCGSIRHSLLPFCDRCVEVKEEPSAGIS